MITMLQQTGNAALKAATPSSKIRFTGFKIGTLEAVAPGTAYTDAQGTIVYTGTATDIKYLPFDDGRLTLQLLVTADKPLMNISNVMLFVNNTVPFCISFGKLTFTKTSTASDGTGMRYMLQIDLRIPDIYDIVDVTNIQQNVIDILRVADEAEFNAAPFEMMARDQLMLQHHEGTGRVVPLLNINGKYWGCPILYRLDKDRKTLFDGGDIGDGYTYTGDYFDWSNNSIWIDSNVWNDNSIWSE